MSLCNIHSLETVACVCWRLNSQFTSGPYRAVEKHYHTVPVLFSLLSITYNLLFLGKRNGIFISLLE